MARCKLTGRLGDCTGLRPAVSRLESFWPANKRLGPLPADCKRVVSLVVSAVLQRIR